MISLTNKIAKFSWTKTTAATIALFLILIMASSLMFMPTAKAATVIVNHHSYTYVAVSPSPPAVIGVGQSELLVLWTADMPPDIGETQGLIPSPAYLGGPDLNRASWSGQSFNVTAPDGITTNYPIGASDPVGGGYYNYVPTEVGTYTVISIFPAVWKNSTNPTASLEAGYPNIEDQYYTDAVSAPVTFNVQQNPAPSYPESPVPTAYWTFPINNAARTWSVLPGNWLNGAWNQPAGRAGGTTLRFQYGVADLTSHVLWTYPYYAGGAMDARFGEISYETGHYQGLIWNSAIILNGQIYTPNRRDGYEEQGYNVISLYTGEIESFQNSTMPSFGQIYNYYSPNQSGGYPYLIVTSGNTPPNGTTITTSWALLDGYTLHRVCYIGNVSSTGTPVIDPTGAICYYNVVNYGNTTTPNFHLTVWNDTAVSGMTAGPPGSGTNFWAWRPEGGGTMGYGGSDSTWFNGATGFSLNVSIPNIMNTPNAILNQTGTIRDVRIEGPGKDYVIIGTAGQNNELGNVPGQLWCIDCTPDSSSAGSLLWKSSFIAPYAATTDNVTLSMTGVYPEDGIIVFSSTKLLTYWGYDMKTGALLWTGAPEPQLNYYNTMNNYYKGMLLTSGIGGVLIAYNITTGQQVWNYTAVNIGGQSPYGNYPIAVFAICDGCIYTCSGEHSLTNPLWRGPNLRCINATDGKEIWSDLGMASGNALPLMNMQMGNGHVVGLNYFDGEVYCYGPGNSATTVSAPQSAASVGSVLTITGTVIDQTPTGRRNDNNAFDFTLKGTPAISDASMSAWMDYLYQDQPFPTNATGVPVSLDTIDPNGNYVHIGDVTSDIHGNYGLAYTPQIPGAYQIIATFAGTHAYGASSASTYMSVGQAPATPAPSAIPLSASDIESTLISYIIIAVIALVIAIAVATILILRKHA